MTSDQGHINFPLNYTLKIAIFWGKIRLKAIYLQLFCLKNHLLKALINRFQRRVLIILHKN
jgi:hypothetical protein